MHAGDIFSGKNVPILDAINGGSGVDMPDTLSKAADFAKNIDTIITGHSTQMTVADLREYTGVQSRFPDRRAGSEEGRDLGRRPGREVDGAGEVRGIRRGLRPHASRATSRWCWRS